MRPEISVILPVRDAATTLSAALESIREQTLRDIEIIVVDDGSTDSTPEIISRAAQLDSRIVPMRAGTGLVDALNLGISAAKAPYIARMDADDVSLPERLRLQKSFLDTHPEIDLASCRVAFGGDAGTARGYALHVDWINGLLDHDAIANNRFIESPLAHPSVMFRRELPARHGGYRDGPFPEDYELWLRWLEAGARMAKLPESLVIWNDPPDRLSRVHPRYSREAFFRVKSEYLARWLKQHNPRHPHITTWGAGRLARRRAEQLQTHEVEIERHIDISPRLIGRKTGGRDVIGPDHIRAGEFVVVFVATRGARDLIRLRLEAQGRVMGRDYICAV